MKRWIESDASELERALLHSELSYAPPADAQSKVWKGLIGVLGGVAGSGGSGPSPAPEEAGPVSGATGAMGPTGVPAPVLGASSAAGLAATGGATLATFIKGFVVGVGVTLASVGGYMLTRGPTGTPVQRPFHDLHADTTPVVPPPASDAGKGSDATPESPLALVPKPAATQGDGGVVGRARKKAPLRPALTDPLDRSSDPDEVESETPLEDPAPETEAPVESQLKREAELLRNARAHLLAGKLSEASKSLDASSAEFPRSVLHQERETLRIELLFRTGQTTTAAKRARAFLGTFPKSPHCAQIRQLLRAHVGTK